MLSFYVLLMVFTGVVREIYGGQNDCPDKSHDALINFDLEQFMGNWYQIETYSTVLDKNGECITFLYTLNGSDSFNITSKQILPNKQVHIATAIVTLVENSGEAKFNLNSDLSPATANIPFIVLQTDYENYGLIWSCLTDSSEIVWIVTRDRTPSKETQDEIDRAIDNFGLDKNKLVETNQSDCV